MIHLHLKELQANEKVYQKGQKYHCQKKWVEGRTGLPSNCVDNKPATWLDMAKFLLTGPRRVPKESKK
jgi:hypothetical protein